MIIKYDEFYIEGKYGWYGRNIFINFFFVNKKEGYKL